MLLLFSIFSHDAEVLLHLLGLLVDEAGLVDVERLEGLIQEMENGNTPLADLVVKFEEGSKLLNHCQAQLREAELKIEQLNLLLSLVLEEL